MNIDNKVDTFILNMFNDHLFKTGYITKEIYEKTSVKINLLYEDRENN